MTNVNEIAAKYGHEVIQNDAQMTPVELTKMATSTLNSVKASPAGGSSLIALSGLKAAIKRFKFDTNDALKYADDVVKECEKISKRLK